jgi:hypothetical protein
MMHITNPRTMGIKTSKTGSDNAKKINVVDDSPNE